MALIVEDGTGGNPLANSYATQAEANTYLTNTGRNSGNWKDAGNTGRDALLVLAAQFMMARWNGKWVGVESYEDQPLDWPRIGAFKRSGYSFDSNAIPEEVKRAQIEYAYAEATNPGSLFVQIAYDDTNRQITASRVRVDVVEESVQYSASNPAPQAFRKFPGADALIKHLVSKPGLMRV